ncbi:hypothetical protein NUW58_g2395 [Xylaria curta]|uniref:Uncharacterized protein n=1 Tax=Xylaria curta TaxID=42375 RepID=A0ACC1PHI8_9PEZI|nr:hypothetical protein NUW58_g2395 [Xylaria curta]
MTKARLSAIIKENVQFASQDQQGPMAGGAVCVFSGAMSGIGAKILEKMVVMFRQSATFYVLGNFSEPTQAHRKRVLDGLLNRGCKIVFIDADPSLISDMDSASSQILIAENKVDYLCISKDDFPPPRAAPATKEASDQDMAVWYFARMRLVSNLLPLLCRSQKPRILNILNGGVDKSTKKPYRYIHGGSLLERTALLTKLAFHHLATENPHITLITSAIGLSNAATSHCAEASKTSVRISQALRAARSSVMERIVGTPPDEALERHLYYLTSSDCSPGSLIADENDELVSYSLPVFEDKRHDEVWDFTVRFCEEALASSAGTGSK